jgi:hypothetical protein
MTTATRIFIEALIRHGKGVIAETEKWLKSQETCDNPTGTTNPIRPAAQPAPSRPSALPPS